MNISHELRYVFIGIPRNASKSMSEWLVANYRGEWHGHHHQWSRCSHRLIVGRGGLTLRLSLLFLNLSSYGEAPQECTRVP